MKKSTQLARQVIRAIGCANGLAGRQLGCENAVEVIKASTYLAGVQTRLPLEWGKIIEEVNTGRHASAMSGVTQVLFSICKLKQSCLTTFDSDMPSACT